MDFKNRRNFKIKNIADKILNLKKSPKIIVSIGIVGICMIFASGFFKKNDFKTQESKDVFVPEQCRERLEQNLENLISNIQGAGKCKVFITLETAAETVYATEERKNKEASEDKSGEEITRKKECNDFEKKLITIKDSQGSEHALAVTQIEPKVKGVVVICPGGDEILVKKRIVDVATTALNVTSARVCVTKSG